MMTTPKIGCIAVVPYYSSEYIGLKCAKGRGIIFPGGKWEPSETFKETALRELKEETELQVRNLGCFFML
jgi:8-oxo-dGTP pyrophosphatase MutT (NUDIX family)